MPLEYICEQHKAACLRSHMQTSRSSSWYSPRAKKIKRVSDMEEDQPQPNIASQTQFYHFPGFVMRDKFLTSLGLSLSHPCRGRNHSLREGCAAPEVKYLVHVRPSGPLVPIFTSWGCRDNVEMLSLSVLKARGPKPRCRQNQFLPEALREALLHASGRSCHTRSGGEQPWAFRGLQLRHSRLCTSFLLPLRTPATGFRAHSSLI